MTLGWPAMFVRGDWRRFPAVDQVGTTPHGRSHGKRHKPRPRPSNPLKIECLGMGSVLQKGDHGEPAFDSWARGPGEAVKIRLIAWRPCLNL